MRYAPIVILDTERPPQNIVDHILTLERPANRNRHPLRRCPLDNADGVAVYDRKEPHIRVVFQLNEKGHPPANGRKPNCEGPSPVMKFIGFAAGNAAPPPAATSRPRASVLRHRRTPPIRLLRHRSHSSEPHLRPDPRAYAVTRSPSANDPAASATAWSSRWID